MSEQTVRKSVHFIPQKIIEELEQHLCRRSINEPEFPIFEKVDKVEFIRTYQNYEGTWEEFKVNDLLIVRVLGGKNYVYTTAKEDEAEKKAFGKRVKYVMKEAKVPWDLAKIAVIKNPVISYNSENTANANALNFIEDMKECLDWYRINLKNRMTIENHLKNSQYSLGHLTNKQIHIIKEYWLSQNA